MTLRDDILAFDDIAREPVQAYGKTLYVHTVSGAEMEQVIKENAGDYGGMWVPLIVACVRDEKGERVFQDSDVPLLLKKGSANLRRLRDVALRLNGYGEEGQAAVEKN